MALITQLAPDLGAERATRASGPGILDRRRNDAGPGDERSGFADLLREASDVRGGREKELRRREEAERPEKREEAPAADEADATQSRATQERERTEGDAEETTARTDDEPRAEEAAEVDDSAEAAAAAAAEALQALTEGDATDAEAEGEGDSVAELFRQLRGESRQESAGPTRTAVPAVTPAAPATDATPGNALPTATTPMRVDTALDLLSPAEMVNVDVQLETEGGEMMDRLQQALAASRMEDLDELGKPVVPQVVRSLAALARNGVSEMRLQLQPGDLGEIEMRVRATEGVVRSELMVQHPEVKQLLESQIARLREALEAHGLRLEGFDVGVSDNGAFARDRDAQGAGDPFGQFLTETPADGEEAAASAQAPVHRGPVSLSDDNVDWLV
jgi:hypothetical protein